METASVNGKTYDQISKEKLKLTRILLFDGIEITVPSQALLEKYVISLENALKPNKRVFDTNMTISSSKYSIIDKICTQVLSSSNMIMELKKFNNNTTEWLEFCRLLEVYVNHFNTILEILGRNDALLSVNSTSSSESKKKRFSIDFICALLLDKTQDIKCEDAEQFRELVIKILDLILKIINAAWDIETCHAKIVTPNLSVIFRQNVNNVAKAVKTAVKCLKCMSDKKLISYERHHTLILLIYLLEQISHVVLQYINTTKSIVEKNMDHILEYGDMYFEVIMLNTWILFHLSLEPEKISGFIKAMEPAYAELLDKPILSTARRKN